MDDEQIDDFVETYAWWQIIPPYIRGVLGWNSAYASKGIPFILEGFYMWLGKRLPAGLVFYASNQMLEFAEQKGLQSHEVVGFVEVQSLWLTDKMP